MPEPDRPQAVLCVGRVYCDVILSGLDRMPSPGTEIYADGVALRAGGGAYITAAYLAALGRPVCLAAQLPSGPLGALVRAEIDGAGLDASLCASAESEDPQLTVALVDSSDRAFVTRRVGAAVPDVSDTALRRLGIGHLHIGELATLAEQPGLLDMARRNGLTVSLDCGWDESLNAEVAPLIGAVDLFLPNESEEHWLSGLGAAPSGDAAPLTVVKCGGDGSRASRDGQRIEVTAEPVEVLDTTGAGDAFNAGFLHRWLSGDPLEACLAAGNRCGAVAVGAVGGFNASRARRILAPATPGGLAAAR
ncbi:sugar/nucleoside kinase (ribokinase family) [Aliiruegeria haliotis]|uniref:Sugar/nucleoside kinase (Ribokinase family) n=1 Tax=Aliiruegeria haliotis TaxID=1280846 RepID=A0A2T0RYC2_9RHOB|nr:PfkB family carbohydrate kinase [Aliiruegeria haliotis]PRY26171.1 sugar/nucleoside kinase (ribokinase family) [Aliiruegeria haliotis]